MRETESESLQELIDCAGELLIQNKSTIAVAESVTSGNIQALFSLAKNTTNFFQGGITAYNLGQKCRHLGVEPIHATEFNCVSEKVAAQMALQVCQLFTCEYGISITGYATPVPEQGIEELFAFISIAKANHIVISKKIKAIPQSASEVQQFYTRETIKLLIELLNRQD